MSVEKIIFCLPHHHILCGAWVPNLLELLIEPLPSMCEALDLTLSTQ